MMNADKLPPMITRLSRRLCPALVLLLTACSMPALIWEHYVDRAVVNRVDDWVDLSPAQHEQVNVRVAAWLEQVRDEFFPRYIVLLHDLADQVETGLDASTTRQMLDRTDDLVRETTATALPWIATTLADLEPEQHRHLAERFREENEAFIEDHLQAEPEQRRREFAERFIDQTERWTGSLSSAQREQVRAMSQGFPETGAEWLAYRSRKQEGLLVLLHEGADAGEIQAYLHCWWIERCNRRPAEIEASERFMDGIAAMVTDVLDLLTARQKNRAVDRLRSRADDLASLLP